jgi:hypothetical protein
MLLVYWPFLIFDAFLKMVEASQASMSTRDRQMPERTAEKPTVIPVNRDGDSLQDGEEGRAVKRDPDSATLQRAAEELSVSKTMADPIDVDVTGKSKFEVAEEMAHHILMNMEKKSWETVTREEYLHLIADCIDVLSGEKAK